MQVVHSSLKHLLSHVLSQLPLAWHFIARLCDGLQCLHKLFLAPQFVIDNLFPTDLLLYKHKITGKASAAYYLRVQCLWHLTLPARWMHTLSAITKFSTPSLFSNQHSTLNSVHKTHIFSYLEELPRHQLPGTIRNYRYLRTSSALSEQDGLIIVIARARQLRVA